MRNSLVPKYLWQYGTQFLLTTQKGWKGAKLPPLQSKFHRVRGRSIWLSRATHECFLSLCHLESIQRDWRELLTVSRTSAMSVFPCVKINTFYSVEHTATFTSMYSFIHTSQAWAHRRTHPGNWGGCSTREAEGVGVRGEASRVFKEKTDFFGRVHAQVKLKNCHVQDSTFPKYYANKYTWISPFSS